MKKIRTYVSNIVKIVVTLLWTRVVNTLFTYIVWQKGYFHPFPLTVGILSLLNLVFEQLKLLSC